MKGRLNLFQVAMLRWRGLHPYNAVHVIRVEEKLDLARMQAAIRRQLTADGLVGLELDRKRRRYEYRGGTATVDLALLDEPGDSVAIVKAEIQRQLNAPFGNDGSIEPFRFFARADSDAYFLGLAYDHFVAGGDSIVALLNDIVARYAGTPRGGPPPELHPPTFARLFARNSGAVLRGLPWLRRTAMSCRRGLRPRYRDDVDQRNEVTFVRVEGAELATMLAQAKAWGVTFNDLLIAAVLRVLADNLPERSRTRRRREVAVASIVNLRAACGYGLRDVFGQFLSSLRLAHAVPPGITLEALARDVRQETARIKTDKLFLQTLLAVRINGIVWMFLSDRQRHRLYSKAFPVSAGLTTLNIGALWTPQRGSPLPAHYWRAVPTGPIAPLVVAATTCGDGLELGLSYRASAAIAPKLDRIAEDLRLCLQTLR